MLNYNQQTHCMDSLYEDKASVWRVGEANVCAPIWFQKLVQDIQSGFTNMEVGVDDQFGQRQFVIPMMCFRKPELFIGEILKHGFLIDGYHEKELWWYLMNEARLTTSKQPGSVEYSYSQLGYHDGEYRLGDGIKNGHLSRYIDEEMTFTAGSEADYMAFLSSVVYQRPELMLAMMIALSAPLTYKLNLENAIVNIVGRSSTGKTTVQRFMASLYGNPEKDKSVLHRTLYSTANAVPQGLSGTNGVLANFDDATSNSTLQWDDLTYTLHSGTTKARLQKSGSIQKKKPGWQTTMVISSENPIIDNAGDKLGLRARITEASDIDWTGSRAVAEKIDNVVLTNYGHIAPKFVNFLETKNQTLKTMYTASRTVVEKMMVQKDGLSPRIANGTAVFHLAGVLIKECFSVKELDPDVLIKKLVDIEQATITSRNPSLAALESLLSFFIQNKAHFKTSGLGDYNEEAKGEVYGCMHYRPGAAGEELGEISILRSKVEELFRKNRITNIRGVLQDWQEQKITVTEAGRLDTKLNVKSGSVPLSARVIKIKVRNTPTEAIYQWLYQKGLAQFGFYKSKTEDEIVQKYLERQKREATGLPEEPEEIPTVESVVFDGSAVDEIFNDNEV